MIIEDLLVELEGGGPEAEQLAEVLGQQIYFAKRNTGITDAQHRVQQTWLVGEVPVTLDGNGDGRDPIGDAYFDRINLASGLSATVNADEPRQIDITAAGGTAGSGADCMFDYLVSPCFATLSGFTEGEVFSSVSGCTFRGYSTIQGAETAVEAAAVPAVVFICGGTYVENVTLTQNASMSTQFFGSGRTRTLINPNSGSAFTYGGGIAVANEVSFSNIGFSKPFTFASAQSLTNCRFTECNFTSIDGAAAAGQARYAVGVKMIRCDVSGGITFTSIGGGALFDFETWQFVDCKVGGIVSNVGSGGASTVTGSLDFLGGTYAGGFNLESSGSGGGIRFGSGVQVSGTILAGANAIRLAENATAGLVMSGVLITSTIMSGPTILLSSAGGLNAEFAINDVNFTGVNTNGYLGTSAGEINRGIFQGCTFPVNGNATFKATATQAVFGNTTFGPNSPDLMTYGSVTTISGGNVFYTTGPIGSGTSAVGSGAPTSASYVVMSADATLTAERVLTAGTGITITDGGVNSTVTIAATASPSVIKQMYISFGEIPGVPYSA